MEAIDIQEELKQFRGTTEYHKHLFPGRSPILLTDGCKYVRDVCKAHWLFDAILSYQGHRSLMNVNFQRWELKHVFIDMTWQLTCREDYTKKALIWQMIQYSDFPIDYIIIWVIDRVALLPSEY